TFAEGRDADVEDAISSQDLFTDSRGLLSDAAVEGSVTLPGRGKLHRVLQVGHHLGGNNLFRFRRLHAVIFADSEGLSMPRAQTALLGEEDYRRSWEKLRDQQPNGT